MQDTFFIKIAEITIKISTHFPLTKALCKDFLIDEVKNPDIDVFANLEEIEADMNNAEEESTMDYSEFICIYRKIAEQLPSFGACVFHGASISYDNKGYLFTAQSGTGKSTHIKLWRQFFGKDVDIINGDKPIIKVTDDKILICSTPWAGKENWKKNRIFPLSGIAFLERSSKSFSEPMLPKDSLNKVINQVYLPKNPIALADTLTIVDKFLSKVPLYKLGCDISEEAVKVSFETLTNKNYEENKIK